MKRILITLILLNVVMVSCVTSEQKQGDGIGKKKYDPDMIYYVAKDGDDNNPGTEHMPWQTVGRALLELRPGQTLYVKEGIYQEVVKPMRSGTPENYITYAAYPGHEVIFDGSKLNRNKNFEDAVFKLISVNYIVVQGFKIENSPGTGIFTMNANNIVIKDNYTNNTWSSGIGAFAGSNITIDNNEVVLACNGGNHECITVAQVDGFEVKNNHVRDGGPGITGGEGIDAKDGARNGSIHNNYVHDINRLGIYVDSWANHTYNIDVYNNIVRNNNAWGICLATENGGLLEDIRVYNNVVYDNVYVGLGIEGDAGWGVPGAAHPFKDIYVYNNTFHNNGSDYWGIGIRINCSEGDGIYIRNNICTMNESKQILIEEGGKPENLVIENNLIYGIDTIILNSEDEIIFSDNSDESPFFGLNTVVLNPDDFKPEDIYVNPGNNDYRLTDGSMAINNGTSSQYSEVDFDGRKRDEMIDIGAFEYSE